MHGYLNGVTIAMQNIIFMRLEMSMNTVKIG